MSEIIIHNDGPIDVAIGNDRNTKTWRNKQMPWSELVAKFSVTKVTYETHAEYIAMKRDKQDEIKDVGGFVGGYCTNGRRKSNTIAHRQLITLDIDRAPSTFWEDYTMLYGEAAALYTTHKHSPASPRYRLVIPLNREVTSDEYEPIARRIAGRLSIDDFDDTTYDVNRLMYWPSTSKDGVFEFHYQDGDWLDADYILNTYVDWRDASAWPVSSRQSARVLKDIKKQGDPLEKPGLIGAFCRTYDIHQAIEKYLSDVYEPCAAEGRYTYKEGSTSGGLIIYDDKYAYSHHGTDPTSGKLCNAFDLVRLHKYGLRDEGKDGVPTNKLPSFTAMQEFAAKDADVRKQLGSERLAEALSDFEGLTDEEETPESTDWLKLLDVDKKGVPRSTIANVVVILENDPRLKGRIAYDDFEKRPVVLKDFPWRKLTPQTRYLTDLDDANLAHYMEKVHEIAGTKIDIALQVLYERTKFHPIRQYLKGLTWDGVERLDTLFIDYLGAEDNAYVRTVSRKALTAAVARVMNPGVKFDYVLTFVSDEGLKKSTLIDKLGKQWYSDTFTTVQGKEAFEQLQGVWLVEMAELSGLKKAEIEAIKHFISKREDRYRVAYGKRLENFPRQCVFIGTTNKTDFLQGSTGNRRFWPVACVRARRTKEPFQDLTEYEINQVWAEAMERYRNKEELYLSLEMEEQALKVQKEHSEYDERTDVIVKYLETKLPADWGAMDVYRRREYINGDDELKAEGVVSRKRVCAAEIWCEAFGGKQSDMSIHNTRFIHDIMRNLNGWEPYKSKTVFSGYGNQRAYSRKVVFGKNTPVAKTD